MQDFKGQSDIISDQTTRNKTNWVLDINLGKILLNMSARILETILLITLHRDIGLRSFKVARLSVFEINTTIEAFKFFEKAQLGNRILQALMSFGPIICQIF